MARIPSCHETDVRWTDYFSHRGSSIPGSVSNDSEALSVVKMLTEVEKGKPKSEAEVHLFQHHVANFSQGKWSSLRTPLSSTHSAPQKMVFWVLRPLVRHVLPQNDLQGEMHLHLHHSDILTVNSTDSRTQRWYFLKL